MAGAESVEIDVQLARLLEMYQVAVSQPRDRMVQLEAVPVGAEFNHPCTNVLVRASAGGQNWQLFVDHDLVYRGEDARRHQVFQGTRRRGWQQLAIGQPVRGDVNTAIVTALEWLESDVVRRASEPLRARESPAGSESRGDAEVAPGGLPPGLGEVGRLLSVEQLQPAGLELTGLQADAVARTAETVSRQLAPRCPLLLGPAGSGRTTVARAAAGELLRRNAVQRVIEVPAGAISAGAVFTAERDERLRLTLHALARSPGTLLVVEQFDLLLAKSDTASSLLSDALDQGSPLIAVARPELQRRGLNAAQLRRRLEVVVVRPPESAEVVSILRRRLEQHPLADQVEVSPQVLPMAVRVSARRSGANPGAALGVLDALLSRAVYAERRCIGPDDVFHLVPQKDESRSY
jgi:hypothetical protein